MPTPAPTPTPTPAPAPTPTPAPTPGAVGFAAQQQDLNFKEQVPKIVLISCDYSATGHKPTQEDRVCISSDLILEHRDEQLNGIRVGFYAVLDGHGGHFSAEFLSTNLTECLREAYGELPVDEGALDEAALRALLTRTCELAEGKLAAEKRMKVTIKPPRFGLVVHLPDSVDWPMHSF